MSYYDIKTNFYFMSVSNLATKYRPTCFADLLGQDEAVSVFKKIASAPGISVRSIVLQGPFGTGKTSTSKIFAKALNCENFKKIGDVCNECEACKQASSGTSQTYWELDSSVVGNVDYIRALSDKLNYFSGGRRLVTIDECHAVSKQAMTALLKIIEDGIPNTMFLFSTTEPVLQTIMSRSVCLTLNPIPDNLIKQRVKQVAEQENIVVPDEILESIVARADGHMRDALSALQLFSLQGDFVSPYRLLCKFILKVLSKKHEEATQLLDEIVKFPSLEIRKCLFKVIDRIASDDQPPFSKVRQAGFLMKVFDFFFSDSVYNALSSEQGIVLALKAFIDKFTSK